MSQSSALMKMVAGMYQGHPGDTVISLGHWEPDEVLGLPHKRFNPQLRLTLDQIRSEHFFEGERADYSYTMKGSVRPKGLTPPPKEHALYTGCLAALTYILRPGYQGDEATDALRRSLQAAIEEYEDGT